MVERSLLRIIMSPVGEGGPSVEVAVRQPGEAGIEQAFRLEKNAEPRALLSADPLPDDATISSLQSPIEIS
jgi:hypothetical protein